jgi:anthranilate synthase/aminodeoxychorismate synthase-like glutamine amidotransferase
MLAPYVLLVIDNYDSFTYNLVQYLAELGAVVEVRRNDEITPRAIHAMQPEGLLLSPGPGNPSDAGITLACIGELSTTLPMLGVCLGHQAIAQAFGARIVRARRLMHGRTSLVHHDGRGVFAELPNPFTATRYHSLLVDPATVPDVLEVTARSDDDEIMGIRHRELPIEGVQFHPESFLTEHGHDLLHRFLQCLPYEGRAPVAEAS